jgi:hypothetical protein
MDLSIRKLFGFYINMVLHTFKHRHAKHVFEFGDSTFIFKITRILLLRNEKKNIYLSTRHVEIC